MAKDAIPAKSDGGSMLSVDSVVLSGVNVELKAKLGTVSLSIADLMALRSGSVVKLDAQISDPIELRLNGQVVARGEIVAVDQNFGVRITELSQVS